MRSIRTLRRALAFAWMIVPAGAAAAQDAAAIGDMERRHVDFVKPGRVCTLDAALEAIELLERLDLPADKLTPQQRTRLFELEVYAALGSGDVARAGKALASLRETEVDKALLADAELAHALAAGDAKAAKEAIEKLPKAETPAQNRQREALKVGLAEVGTRAPEATIVTADGGRIAAHDRNKTVLLIDFWATKHAHSQAALAALRMLSVETEPELLFLMVGVNTDSDTTKAKKYVADKKLNWKQCYEGKESGAPITHTAFKIGAPPVRQVLIDGRGYVRASGPISEPGIVYAARAALGEAKGLFPYVAPRNLAGEPAVKEPGAGAAGGGAVKKADAKPAAGELPSNPDAANLLLRARAAMRAGMRNEARKLFQEIIDKYPGTKEAKEAEELMPSP